MEVVRDLTPAKLPDLHDYATGSALLQQSACWRVRPNCAKEFGGVKLETINLCMWVCTCNLRYVGIVLVGGLRNVGMYL